MNTLTLIGNLTRDPELRTRGETTVCDMRLAESNGHPDSPLYINVAAFGAQAERCLKSLRQGSQVAVTGQLRFREWKTDTGSRRSEYSIAAERIDFLLIPPPTDPAEKSTELDQDDPLREAISPKADTTKTPALARHRAPEP